MVTTAELTERYISEHPSIKDCLKKGVLNYSKLARAIAKDLDIEKKTSKEAILIAARRFAKKLKEEASREEKIRGILRKGELEIKNKIVIIITEKIRHTDKFFELEKDAKKEGCTFYIIEGSKTFTIITSKQYSEKIKKLFHEETLKTKEDLAMVIIKSPPDIENCSGVVSYIYSLFSDNNVNILETMSCWTDTILVIDEKDISKTMQFLKF
ncbi:hypothetical protein FJZ53_00185 [Candidatus Woesearchaeota archaeon]|nr:hypothetical protein [Candidatus Woesearchaeota archaeon]